VPAAGSIGPTIVDRDHPRVDARSAPRPSIVHRSRRIRATIAELTARGGLRKFADMQPRSRTVLVAVALACAKLGCEATPATSATSAAPAATPVAAPVVAAAPAKLDLTVPADPAELRAWLQAFSYRGWTPQTDIRATGEHGGERLYFNDVLTRSMRAGAAEHPLGSAAVRELYAGDLRTLKGFALMHKTAPSGTIGEGWFWYEILGTTAEAEPSVAEPAARACVGCHAHAVDFVHSPETTRDDPQPEL
jgi:hypothetical protein